MMSVIVFVSVVVRVIVLHHPQAVAIQARDRVTREVARLVHHDRAVHAHRRLHHPGDDAEIVRHQHKPA